MKPRTAHVEQKSCLPGPVGHSGGPREEAALAASPNTPCIPPQPRLGQERPRGPSAAT